MARTLPDRCPSKHPGFTGIGLRHQRPVPQQLEHISRSGRGFALAVSPRGDEEAIVMALTDKPGGQGAVKGRNGHGRRAAVRPRTRGGFAR